MNWDVGMSATPPATFSKDAQTAKAVSGICLLTHYSSTLVTNSLLFHKH